MKETLINVMKTEMYAIARMITETGDRYAAALDALKNCKGKVIFTGVGKSGHIGEKLAATFSSTGTPSFFVHSTEALHGDLGMIEARDAVILISNGGATAEALRALDGLKKIGCVTIAFTSAENSPLAEGCDLKLIYPKCAEADHLNLAPTVSSTLALVLGDALACALSKDRGFTKEEFHGFHPEGSLGKKLESQKNEGVKNNG
jgi:KpsF/GutQ family protein